MEVSPAMARQFAEAAKGEPSMAPSEFLLAWDPVAQEERWRVPIATVEWIGGGVLTTAGNLVIQGTGSGQLMVYRADTGEKLHEIEVGTAIIAAPISYEIDGEQYVAVIAGFGGALNAALAPQIAATRFENYGRILAFKLGGGPTPLPPQRTAQPVPEPPDAPCVLPPPPRHGAPACIPNGAPAATAGVAKRSCRPIPICTGWRRPPMPRSTPSYWVGHWLRVGWRVSPTY